MNILISPVELKARIARGNSPHLLDVRWRPIAPNGQPDYVSGHLPNASYVDLEGDLAFRTARSEGRHPLPPIDFLQAAIRRWGINDGDEVVVYDDNSSISAARAWWVLRHAGITNVRILDGALQGWRDIGGTLEAGTPVIKPGRAHAHYGHLPVVGINAVASLAAQGRLIDARATEHFLGLPDIGEPRGGHIPGARNLPTAANLTDRGFFKTPDELRQRFLDAGLDPKVPVAVYCTSGIAAAHEVVALTLAGYQAALYPGSWSQWVNTEHVATEQQRVLISA